MAGLLVVSIGIARYQNTARSNGQVDVLSRTVNAVTTPISKPLGQTLDNNSRFWSAVFVSASLRQENENFKALERSWSIYQQRVDALERQLAEARKTMSLPALAGRERVAADILSFDPLTSRVTLSVGSSKGVAPGQAVVCGQGFVGQIQSVEASRSQALLVSSPVLRIGGMVAGDPPQTGLLRGQGTRKLLLEIVDSTRAFRSGDIVLTSVHSERTPPNILIGYVLNQEPAQEYGITRLTVVSSVDISKVREVYVLK